VVFASLGGYAGSVLKMYGNLRQPDATMYWVRTGGDVAGGGIRGALCNVDGAMQVGYQGTGGASLIAPNLNWQSGWSMSGLLLCRLGIDNATSEAGRYPLTLEVRDIALASSALGGGQPLFADHAPQDIRMLPATGPVSGVGRATTNAIGFGVTLRPLISHVSLSELGLGGGSIVTITGAGFSTRHDNEVLLAGVPCTVITSDARGITCKAGAASASSPRAVTGTLYPGGAGLLHTFYEGSDGGSMSSRISDLRWKFQYDYGTPPRGADSKLKPLVLPVRDPTVAPTFASINADAVNSRAFYYGPLEIQYHEQQLEGFFVAPVSANYSFYVRGDDYVAVWMSLDANASRAELIAITSGYTTSFWDADMGYAQRSLKIWSEAGVPRYIKVHHVDKGGKNWFDMAIRVHTENGANTGVMQSLTSPAQLESRSAYNIQKVVITADSGSFELEFDLGDGSPLRRTTRLDFSSKVGPTAWDVRYVVSKAVPELVDIETTWLSEDMDMTATPVALTYGSGMRVVSRDTTSTTVTFVLQFFGSVAARLQPVRVIARGTSADGYDFLLKLAGSTAGVMGNTTVLEESGGDPFYWPAPMDFFRTALPLPAVEVRCNGLLAVCSHFLPLNGTVNEKVNYYTPGFEGIFPPVSTMSMTASGLNGCAAVYRADITPTITSVAKANGDALSIVTYGDSLLITGTTFLTLVDGVGMGMGSLNLTVGQLAVVTFVGTAGSGSTPVVASCRVTAATATALTCSVDSIPAGTYTSVRVVVALGRGLASFTTPSFTAAATVSAVAPSSGSRAGGTVVVITGTGYLPTENVVLFGNLACAVLSSTPTSITCVSPVLDSVVPATSTASLDKSVSVNGVLSSRIFTYDAALTPVVTAVFVNGLTALSSATSGSVAISISNIPVSSLTAGSITVTVTIGSRVCAVTKVDVSSPTSAPTAVVTCTLTRTDTLALPQAPLVPVVSVGSLGIAALTSAASPALDVGFRITSVSPSSGSLAGGTRVVIAGIGFGTMATTVVNFALPTVVAAVYVPCSITTITSTTIECVLSRPDYEGTPELAAARNLTGGSVVGAMFVTTNRYDAACTSTAACSYTFASEKTPTLTSLDASSLDSKGAGNVVLTGTFLAAPLTVWFGSWPATVVSTTATSATVTVPPQTAGNISVWCHSSTANGNSEGLLSVLYPLLVSSMSASEGSTAGGHTVVISGLGFSENSARNVVRFGTAKATVVSLSSSSLTVLTPANAVGTSIVSVTVLDGRYISNTSAIASVTLSFAYSYTAAATPTLSSVSPSTLASGATLTLTGSGLGTSGTISVGGVACVSISWSATGITCTLGDSPAGTHVVAVSTTAVGLATGTRSVTVALTATASAATISVSAGGGALVALTGAGFSPNAGANVVTVCGLKATVTSSTYTSLSFLSPVLPTKSASVLYNTYQWDTLRTGTVDSTASAPAVDGSTTSRFFTCRVTLDLGLNVRGLVSRVRFFPIMGSYAAFEGSVFSAAENSTGPWETLYTASSVLDGWNVGNVDVSALRAYRFLRWQSMSSGSSCKGQEIEFIGKPFIAGEAAACPVTVAVLTPASPLVPAISSPVITLAATIAVSTASTPTVTSIVPEIGSALGGDTIELRGTGFGPGVKSVVLNGMPCTVTAERTDKLIKCVTGVRTSIQPVSVRVTINGVGLALVNDTSLVYFSYLDKWSALTTWLDNEPPVDGDTVIVPLGQAILVDVSPPELFLVLVQGELRFDSSALQLDFTAHYIVVLGGSFEIGTEDKPFMNKLTITLKGRRSTAVELPGFGAKTLGVMPAMPDMASMVDPAVVAAAAEPGGVADATRLAAMRAVMGDEFGLLLGSYGPYVTVPPPMADIPPLDRLLLMSATPSAGKAIAPELQGFVEIHGAPRKRTWTFGGATSLAGSNVIVVSEDVDWSAGEYLAISSSSSDAGQTERVRVLSVAGDMRTITLESPLVYDHECYMYRGGEALGFSSTRICFEVGLLSRNIVIQGDETSASEQFGMHSIAAMGSVFRVENAEMRNCGQSLIVGRYCVHIHLAGEAGTSYARSNSFHDSFQRAVTLHASNNVHVDHNVAFRVMAHSFFVEDGVELANVFDGNLVMSQLTSPGPIRSDAAAACFWTSSPGNIWRNNVCAGGSSNGFFFQPPAAPTGPSATNRITPSQIPLGQFFNNTVHSTGVALMLWLLTSPIMCNDQVDQFVVNNTFFRCSTGIFIGATSPRVYYKNNVLIENGDGVIWHHMCSNWRSTKPVLSNTLFVATMDNTVRPPTTGGLYLPENDYVYVKDLAFVNFGAGVSTMSTCQDNGCVCGSPSVVTRPTKSVPPHDGNKHGFTFRVSGMRYVNSSVRMAWDRTDAIEDLDGSFTGGIPGGWATAYHSYNDVQPQCHRDTTGALGYGLICNAATTIRGVFLSGISPSSDAKSSLIISGGSALGTWAAPNRTEIISSKTGQLVLLVSAQHYGIKFDGGNSPAPDWEAVSVRYSDPSHLLSSPLHEWLGLTFTWVAKRYSISAYYPSSTICSDKPCSNQLELPTYRIPAPMSSPPVFGSGVMSNSSTWTVMLSKSLPRGSEFSGSNVSTLAALPGWAVSNAFTFDMSYHLCPPIGCNPVPTGSLGSPVAWSSLTWPAPGEDVTINPDQYIMLDVSPPPIGRLFVYGRLEFVDGSAISQFDGVLCLKANGIIVWGSLAMGTPAAPMRNRAEIVLTGDLFSDGFVIDDKTVLGNKAMLVYGNVTMCGAPRVDTWTRLSTSANKGTTTLSLTTSVAAAASAGGWMAGDVVVLTETEYSPSSQSATTVENATVLSVSADGLTLTLTAPLAFTHYAGPIAATGPLATRRLAAAVGLVTRNVVVRGDAPLAGGSAPYGGRVFVSAVTTGAGTTLKTYVGSLVADHAEFRDMGQEATSWAAIDIQLKGRRAIVPSSLNAISIHRSFSAGIVIVGVPDFSITQSVLYSTRVNGLYMDAASVRPVIVDTLVVGNYLSPHTYCCGRSALDKVTGQAGIMLGAVPGRLMNNYVSGAFDAGYTVPGVDCADSAALLAATNNEAAGVMIGYFILPLGTASR